MSFSQKLSFEIKVFVKVTFMITLYVHCNYKNSFSLIVVLIHSQKVSNYVSSFVRILCSCFKWTFIEYTMCLASPTKGKKEKEKKMVFYKKRFLKATNLFASHTLQLIKLEVN